MLKVILAEVLSHNQGDTMSTIQQLLNDKFSNKIPSPLSPLSHLSPHPGTPNLPLFPSPLSVFPQKAVSMSHSFTNNIAAAASSHRFNPYHYNRYNNILISL